MRLSDISRICFTTGFIWIMTIPDSCLMMENGGSCVPCTPEEEKKLVKELSDSAESNLKAGDLFYIVSNRWYSCWKRYVGQINDEYLVDEQFADAEMDVVSCGMMERPGPIDNSDILMKDGDCDANELEIIRPLQEGTDYVLVAEAVWQKFYEWYGGGPALPRKMIYGNLNKQFDIEVYPLRLKLTDIRNNSESIIRVSRKATYQELHEMVYAVCGVKQEARIWDYYNKNKYSILPMSDDTLEESTLQMDQDILLEVQVDGHWPTAYGMDSTSNDFALVPIEPSRLLFTIAGGPTLSNDWSTGYGSNLYQSTLASPFTDTEDGYEGMISREERRGLAGLQNLGNTCFMNSAIQCLVHTPPLVEYFLQDYTPEINEDNPLGMHGELAVAFGDLLRKLWSSGHSAVAPRVFKGKLARFAPQFSGYNQHDSQELLAFLLDGLHEDLNRVKQKPYIETKDSDGRKDAVVADECWTNHKARNDSVIVDFCQGQYKSTLTCPNCGKISITFDPFMYLSLPLPSKITRSITVTVCYGDGSGLPMPYTVMVLKHGCCKDLSQALGAACCLNTDESLLLAEVYENRIYRYLENSLEPLSMIKNEEQIVAYRLPKKQPGSSRIELRHRCLENLKPGYRKFSGTPLVTYIDDLQTGADIDMAVERVLSPLRRKAYSATTTHQENGVVSEAFSKPMAHTELGCEEGSMNIGESGDIADSSSSFELFLTDAKDSNVRAIEKDSPLKAGQPLIIILDWTNRVHESYDASYLRDLPEVCKTGFAVKKTRQEAVTLFSCLEAFLSEEPLGPDDMWYCPSCKEHKQATKKLDLWSLPDILVFHLKRFSYSRYLKNKLDTFVNFPIHDLDLSKYVKSEGSALKPNIYELYAISNHYGGLGGGHYSAYAKLVDENRWYHFDDSHVSPVSEDDVRTPAAYVLFYRRAKPGSKMTNGIHTQFQ